MNPAPKNRPRLLAVIPYGMALRNIALNEALWTYLTTEFRLDLLTSMRLARPSELHAARVYQDVSPRFVDRPWRALKRRLTGALRLMDSLRFYASAGDFGSFASIYRYSELTGILGSHLFLSWLGHTRLRRTMHRVAKSVIACRLGNPVDAGQYDYILLGHTSELLCAQYGAIGNKLRIPVIALLMGVDNLMHGPLLFCPDLLLVWGEEQRLDFLCQVQFNPELKSANCLATGGTIFDAFRNVAEDACYSLGDSIRPEDEIILYPAHLTFASPFQFGLCELLVEYARKSQRSIKILVRLRPGIDEALWEKFRSVHRDRVVLQNPRAASFDKSGNVKVFDLGAERTEVERFVATLKRAVVTVTPSLSTLSLDAMAFGKPVIAAVFNPTAEDEPHPDLVWYREIATRRSPWRGLRVVTCHNQLMDSLDDIFERRRASDYCSDDYFRFRAGGSDGRAGERAIGAIRAFLAGRT